MVLRMQLAGGDQPDEAVSTAEPKPAAHTLAWLWAPRKKEQRRGARSPGLLLICWLTATDQGVGAAGVLRDPKADGAAARLVGPTEPQPTTCPRGTDTNHK